MNKTEKFTCMVQYGLIEDKINSTGLTGQLVFKAYMYAVYVGNDLH